MKDSEYKVYAHIGDNKVTHEVSIVDENYLPLCFYLQAYLDTSYGTKFNTKHTKSKMLLFSYRYFSNRKIDIVNRIKSLTLFTNGEIDDFLTACLYYERFDFQKNIVSFGTGKISDKQIDRLIYENSINIDRVSIDTTKTRINEFIKYLNYLYDIHYLQLGNRNKLSGNFNLLINKLNKHRSL